MKLHSFLFVICLSFMVSACGKMDLMHTPAPGIADASSICIVKNDSTRPGFLQALESWFQKESIRYKVLPSNATIADHEWVITYFGAWSWDLAIFLSHAEINAYHNGKLAGREKLLVGQWDKNKFEKGEQRIHKLMDMLYDKTTHYTPTGK